MVRAPIAIMLILAIGMGWQFTFFDEPLPGFEPDGKIDDPKNTSDDTFGFVTDFTGMLGAIWDGVLLFGKLLTFSLVEGPDAGVLSTFWTVFTWTFRVLIPGSLLWSIVSLVRG